MNSYASLLNMRYHRGYSLLMIIVLSLILLCLSCFFTSYDEFNTYGIYGNNSILVDVPIDNSDVVTQGKYIKIAKQKYPYKVLSISELKRQETINYQTYEIQISSTFQKNEVLKITFYYHPQKIIEKIINYIF